MQQYAGYMLRHFGGPAPAEYLSRHPDEYVVAVRLPLRPADMPRRPDGAVDIEAFPERIFGPEHVKRHPDGSTEYIDIPESKFRELDQSPAPSHMWHAQGPRRSVPDDLRHARRT